MFLMVMVSRVPSMETDTLPPVQPSLTASSVRAPFS